MRFLIEFYTGYFTGSIYNRDVMLDRDFFGERQCSQTQSAIKVRIVQPYACCVRLLTLLYYRSQVHPQDIEWRPHPNPHRSIVLKERGYRIKCTNGNMRTFGRCVAV
jgi:hypothetical protein